MSDVVYIDESNIETTTESLANIIDKHIDNGKRISVTVKVATRSLPQNALLHVWVSQISKHLIKIGRPYCSETWVKRQLKGTFLGTETIESVDLLTGKKTQTEEVRHSSGLDIGEFNFFLNRVQEWAVDIGLILSAPLESEFIEINNRQVM